MTISSHTLSAAPLCGRTPARIEGCCLLPWGGANAVAGEVRYPFDSPLFAGEVMLPWRVAVEGACTLTFSLRMAGTLHCPIRQVPVAGQCDLPYGNRPVWREPGWVEAELACLMGEAAPVSSSTSMVWEDAGFVTVCHVEPYDDATAREDHATSRALFALASGALSGQLSGRIEGACEYPWDQAWIHQALHCPFSLRIDGQCDLPWGNWRAEGELVLPYGPLQIDGETICPWDDAARVTGCVIQAYGPKTAETWCEEPFGNAPVVGECLCPIHGTVSGGLEIPWSVRGWVDGLVGYPWGSTTTVAGQCDHPCDLLPRNPVSGALTCIWDLATPQTPILPEGGLRVFHRGVLL